MTGCYPHTHQLMGLVPRGWEMNVDSCPPLPQILKNAGYETHLFGLQHEHWDPYRLGYKTVHEVRSTHCEDVSAVFVDWMKGYKQQGQPFFANVGFFEPHRIGLASQGHREDLPGTDPSHFRREVYDSADPADVDVRCYWPDIPPIRTELADFYGAISFMDDHVGRLLCSLDDAGLHENSIVIFVTDHGASFPHAKGTLYDGGTKVAAIMRWPVEFPASHRVNDMTSHVDFVPTLLDLLELPDSIDGMQGESFSALLRDQEGETRTYVFAEKNYTQYYDPQRMVRSDSIKYIRKGLTTGPFDFVLTEIELAPTSFRSRQDIFDFYVADRCTEEIFDLRIDPAELHNQVDVPAYRTVLDEMRAVLNEHMAATDDPFLNLRNELQMPVDVYAKVRRK
jgi:arylsulfatase A-like enzyme